MLVVALEKKCPYSGAWSARRCALDTERRLFYYSDRVLQPQPEWKRAMKVSRVRLDCEERPCVLATLQGADAQSLYVLHLEGVQRSLAGLPVAIIPPLRANGPTNCSTFKRPTRGRPSLPSPRTSVTSRGAQVSSSTLHGAEKLGDWTFRCDSQETFLQLVDVLTDVLADDGLCPPVHGGLPVSITVATDGRSSYVATDPRSGLVLSRVPPHLLYAFKSLDKTVFYCLQRGDLVGTDQRGTLQAVLPGAYLCVTDEMVLVMRDNATVPRWITVHSIAEVHYNTTAPVPFIALLTSGPSPDIVFMPGPPLHRPQDVRAYSGARAVGDLLVILRGLKAFLSDPADPHPMTFRDVNEYAVLSQYVKAQVAVRIPKWVPVPGYSQPLLCPLPKQQLAEMLAQGRVRKAGGTDAPVAPTPAAAVGGERRTVAAGQLPPGLLRRTNQTPVVYCVVRRGDGASPAMGRSVGQPFASAMGTSVPAGFGESLPEHFDDSFAGAPAGLAVAHRAAGPSQSCGPDSALGSSIDLAASPGLPVITATNSGIASTVLTDEIEEAHLDDLVRESVAAAERSSGGEATHFES